jgi:hypothetical protein
MRPTLVFLKAYYADGRLIHGHGDEVPPGLFTKDVIDRALDEGFLAQHDSTVRQSLYDLFPRFSGSKEQQQEG